MLVLCRGVPKKRLRAAAAAAARANTETSIVVATPSVMQFPINEAVQRAAAKKRERQASSSSEQRKPRDLEVQVHQLESLEVDPMSLFHCSL